MLEIIKSIRLLLSTKCIPYVNDKHSTQALIKLKEKLDVLDPSPLENVCSTFSPIIVLFPQFWDQFLLF